MNKRNALSQNCRLFLVIFLFYLFFGFCLSYFCTFSYDTFFGADNSRVFLDLSSITASHERIKVHPLFLLLTQPAVLMLNGIIRNAALSVMLLEAFVSAASAVTLAGMLSEIRVSRRIRAIAMVLYVCSFSSLIFSGIPETFIFSAAGLIFYWAFLLRVSNMSQPFSKSVYGMLVVFGIISFGITLTNYAVYIIGLIYFYSLQELSFSSAFRKFFLLNVINGCIILILTLFQNLVWSECPVFFVDLLFDFLGMGYPESHYMNWAFSLEKILQWLRQVILYPLVSPGLTWASDISYVEFGNYSSIPGVAVVLLCLLLFCSVIQCILSALQLEKKQKNFFLMTLAALLFHLALHFVYGSSEAFMYTPHFLFLLIFLFAAGFQRAKPCRLKTAAAAILAVLTVFAAGNNCFRAIQAAEIALANVDTGISWPTVVIGVALIGAAACMVCWMAEKLSVFQALPSVSLEAGIALWFRIVLICFCCTLVCCLFIMIQYKGISGSIEYYRVIFLLLGQRFGLS